MRRAADLLAQLPWRGSAGIALIAVLTWSAGSRLPPLLLEKKGVFDDIALYTAITARVQAGENYYTAAAAEQRSHGYPTRPAVTIREPTEAWILAALGGETAGRVAIIALTFVMILTLLRVLEQQGAPLWMRGASAALAVAGTIDGFRHPYSHEAWASLFICIALSVWRPNRYGMSVALVLMACLFRELAAPVLLVMGVCAAMDRSWREVGAWCAATVVFGVLALIHMGLASHAAWPTDPVSPGWTAMGGWRFILLTARRHVLFQHLPGPALSIAVALALLGLLKAEGAWGRRLAATTFTFVALFWFVGRPDNDYWGILYGTLLPLGLIYVPRVVRDSGFVEFLAGPHRGSAEQIAARLAAPPVS